ncbi:protein FAM221B [Biomphalaria glabrata]|nr:FAM221B-like protein [Biomphalaria glabrata]KAI8788982.1 protein FAM221B [Biomphalaria glabrata]
MKKTQARGSVHTSKDQQSDSKGASKPSSSTTLERKSNAASKTKVGTSQALAPKGQQGMMQKLQNAQLPIKKVDGMYVPEGYKMRVIKPAEKYDVVSMAKAMNDDFAPKLKELFDVETAAAIQAQKSGMYIGWRCPDFKHDCQRIFHTSRCFCDHKLSEHAQYHAKSVKVPCQVPGCSCKAYMWIPNRPEDIGEFWLPKRPGFDATAWRAKCKCKHTHNFHDPNRPHRCKTAGCPCFGFHSDFLCAACDRHWEEHQTFFDSEQSRREQGLPVGTDWLPFAEMPDLRNIALSGNEYDDSKFLELRQFDAIPSNAITGNDQPVQLKGNREGGTGFKPVYD